MMMSLKHSIFSLKAFLLQVKSLLLMNHKTQLPKTQDQEVAAMLGMTVGLKRMETMTVTNQMKLGRHHSSLEMMKYSIANQHQKSLP